MDALGISMVIAIGYLAALFAVLKFKMKGKSKGRFIFINLSILYLLLLISITLLPISGSVEMPPNFLPFVNILAKTDQGYVFNVSIFFNYLTLSLLNVLLFVPFGFFLCCYLERHPFLLSLFCGFLASILIELLQLALPINRTFDVDDLIFNTIGSVLGFFLYVWISKLLKRRKSRDEDIRNQ